MNSNSGLLFLSAHNNNSLPNYSKQQAVCTVILALFIYRTMKLVYAFHNDTCVLHIYYFVLFLAYQRRF